MTRRLAAAAFLVALTATIGAVSSTHAGPVGSWTRVTEPNGRNIDQVGLARTGDGVLHVAWVRRTGATAGIGHATVNPFQGNVGPANTVVAGLSAVANPALAVLEDGTLGAFFGGLGKTPEEGGVVAAISAPSGKAWKRQGVRVSSTTSAVGPVGAAVTGKGDPIVAFAYSFTLAFHVGLDPKTPDTAVQPSKQCCDYVPGLATDDKSGQTVLAWFSNAKGRVGVWARAVSPAVGKPLLAPGSATGGNALTVDQQTAISARPGAVGVYVAYCTGYPVCKKTVLWRVGGGALTVGGSEDVEDVAVAPAPDGRLWVMWHDGQSSTQIHAVRTNKAATKVGPVITIKPPNGTSAIWKLSGEGSHSKLDLLASVTTGSQVATWHTQVRPRLAFGAEKGKDTVTFTVLDAGDPVAGATVAYGGKTAKTGANGKVTMKLAPGSNKATVALEPYEPAGPIAVAG